MLHGNSCEELLTFTVTGVSVHVARITSLSVHRARLVIVWSLVSNSQGGGGTQQLLGWRGAARVLKP